jgi:hypothetical protein
MSEKLEKLRAMKPDRSSSSKVPPQSVSPTLFSNAAALSQRDILTGTIFRPSSPFQLLPPCMRWAPQSANVAGTCYATLKEP